MDVLLQFTVPYINGMGYLVTDPRLIGIRYATGWIVIDLVASFPFDAIFSIQSNTSAIKVLKCAKLLRIFRFKAASETPQRHLVNWERIAPRRAR